MEVKLFWLFPGCSYEGPGVQTEEAWCESFNLKFFHSVAKENIATVECLGRDNYFFCSGSPYHSEVARCL